MADVSVGLVIPNELTLHTAYRYKDDMLNKYLKLYFENDISDVMIPEKYKNTFLYAETLEDLLDKIVPIVKNAAPKPELTYSYLVNWNTIYPKGTFIVELDTQSMKVGDGKHSYGELLPISGSANKPSTGSGLNAIGDNLAFAIDDTTDLITLGTVYATIENTPGDSTSNGQAIYYGPDHKYPEYHYHHHDKPGTTEHGSEDTPSGEIEGSLNIVGDNFIFAIDQSADSVPLGTVYATAEDTVPDTSSNGQAIYFLEGHQYNYHQPGTIIDPEKMNMAGENFIFAIDNTEDVITLGTVYATGENEETDDISNAQAIYKKH